MGGLDTFDPLDPRVAEWWRKKVDEIYRRIPDFGGFVVKADSEGRLGPSTYGRTPADAANVIARALKPHGGVVFYRAFVYNHHLDWHDLKNDRAKAAYDNFHPLDGAFDDNVIIQIKNGPIDFQVREPASPLFAGLRRTNEAIELQITQEYTGQQRHLCFLVPMWKEVLDFDMRVDERHHASEGSGRGPRFPSPHRRLRRRRQRWHGCKLDRQPARDGESLRLRTPRVESESQRREDCRRMDAPHFRQRPARGQDHQPRCNSIPGTSTKVTPARWAPERSPTLPAITTIPAPNRRKKMAGDNGTAPITQESAWIAPSRRAPDISANIPRPCKSCTRSLADCPDNLLLFFHHVPYTYVLHSGKTVIQHIYDSHYEGADRARDFIAQWKTLEGHVDDERYRDILARLQYQAAEAVVWRDAICNWIYQALRHSGRQRPRRRVRLAQPQRTIAADGLARHSVSRPCAFVISSVNVYAARGVLPPRANSFFVRQHWPEKWANLPLLSVTSPRRWALPSAPCIAPCTTIPASAQRPKPGFWRWRRTWATVQISRPAIFSSKKTLRISVNTLQGTTSFWDEVRAGIREAAASILLENVEIEFRTYPRLGEGDEEAFEAAIADKVDGIITFPSRPQILRPWIRRASRAKIPVVCVATDAPDSGRLGIVAVDTLASGSIAADLMGRFIGPREGSVAITVFDMAITEHAEKYAAFENTLRSFYPNLNLLKPIEDHDVEAEAYRKCRELFEQYPEPVPASTSQPRLRFRCWTPPATRNVLDRLTIITTDLFPDLVPQIRSGAVAATIYQRPRAQGQIAFRMLHEFLVEGGRSIASGRAGSASVDARQSGFLSAATIAGIAQRKNRQQPREATRDLAEDIA